MIIRRKTWYFLIQPGDGAAHGRLALPASIETPPPTEMPTGQSDTGRGNSSTEALPFQVCRVVNQDEPHRTNDHQVIPKQDKRRALRQQKIPATLLTDVLFWKLLFSLGMCSWAGATLSKAQE